MTSLAAQAVGAWVAGLTLPDVPANIRAIARSCLVDTVGVALAGSAEPAATLVRAYGWRTLFMVLAAAAALWPGAPDHRRLDSPSRPPATPGTDGLRHAASR